MCDPSGRIRGCLKRADSTEGGAALYSMPAAVFQFKDSRSLSLFFLTSRSSVWILQNALSRYTSW